MASLGQKILAQLWWGPLRRPTEALARRLPACRRRIVAGPLRGLTFRGGLAQHLGIYELPVQDTLRGLLRPDDVFYDVGGHRGYFTLLAAITSGPGARVFTFEPLPENFAAIEAVRKANGLDQVEVLPWAIGDSSGEADLYRPESGDSAVPSLLPSRDARRLRVTIERLDAVASEHPPPDVVKVDVEGAEDRVLEGARSLLESTCPRWVIEVHSEESSSRITSILGAYGYRLRPIEARHPKSRDYPRHLVAEPVKS